MLTGVCCRGWLLTVLPIVALLTQETHSQGIGSLYKVALTQNGYIQFVRYPVDVPTLQDFTVCIWIKSTNHTHAQPILSYSKHETDRLIRLWISPHGSEINLEILGSLVMTANLGIYEGHWYHLCQAWSGRTGLWNFYVNKRLMATGEQPYPRAGLIPGGGDLVVGQEYTDFDKGLDDGIEGLIFGFNLLANSQHANFGPQTSPLYSHWGLGRRRRRRAVFKRPPVRGYRQSRSSRRFVHENYDHCLRGRGSPSTDPHVLVHWARTPVMVFGGAVMKTAEPLCGAF